MVIAVNTADFLFPKNNDELLFSFLTKVAETYNQHQFIFIGFDDQYTQIQERYLSIKPVTSASLLSWIKYKHSLKSHLKKNKVDIFITAYPFKWTGRNVWLIPSLDALSSSKQNSVWVQNFYKKHLQHFAQNSTAAITASQNTDEVLVNSYHYPPEKTFNLNLQSDEVFERENVKLKYAEGCEYFLFFAGGSNVKDLLTFFRAFSFFKQRQKSSMKLLVVTDNFATEDELIKLTESYKYKNDVNIHKLSSKIYELMQGAYAVLITSFFYGFVDLPQLVFKAGTALLIPDSVQVGSYNAQVLTFNDTDHIDIADKMMMIFKDEQWRKEQITNNYSCINPVSSAIDQQAELINFLEHNL